MQKEFCFFRNFRRWVMGTIVFLILRFVFGINNYGDGQTLATLVSLDTIALMILLLYRKKS